MMQLQRRAELLKGRYISWGRGGGGYRVGIGPAQYHQPAYRIVPLDWTCVTTLMLIFCPVMLVYLPCRFSWLSMLICGAQGYSQQRRQQQQETEQQQHHLLTWPLLPWLLKLCQLVLLTRCQGCNPYCEQLLEMC